VARHFSWWGAVLFSGLCLAGTASIVRAGARSDAAGLLTAAALACAFAAARVAGAADPLLLLFEATAAGALTFIDEPRAQWIVATIGVAGAVLTKVEGLSFAAAVLITVVVMKPRSIARVLIVVPGALLIGAWLGVIAYFGTISEYLSHGPLHIGYLPRVVPETLRSAEYDTWWIPWIAPLAVVALGDVRRARAPLFMAALTFGATIYFYLHGPSEWTIFWIRSSAQRVLLTPLLLLLMAAGAAMRDRAPERIAP
jgi:hypothetical protein